MHSYSKIRINHPQALNLWFQYVNKGTLCHSCYIAIKIEFITSNQLHIQ